MVVLVLMVMVKRRDTVVVLPMAVPPDPPPGVGRGDSSYHARVASVRAGPGVAAFVILFVHRELRGLRVARAELERRRGARRRAVLEAEARRDRHVALGRLAEGPVVDGGGRTEVDPAGRAERRHPRRGQSNQPYLPSTANDCEPATVAASNTAYHRNVCAYFSSTANDCEPATVAASNTVHCSSGAQRDADDGRISHTKRRTENSRRRPPRNKKTYNTPRGTQQRDADDGGRISPHETPNRKQ